MNVWIAVWDGAALVERADRALRSMVAVHPRLAQGECTTTRRDGRAWAGVVASPTEEGGVAEVATRNGALGVIDGIALDADDSVVDAGSILDRPLDPVHLEGQFSIVRCDRDSIGIVNDAAGLRHLYWWRQGRSIVLANSVEVIARTVDGSLDVDAAALYLAFGWPAGDSTLCTGVSQVAAGQVWQLDERRTSFSSHFHRRELTGQRRWHHDPMGLARRLEGMLTALARLPGGIQVPLSGGLDSRVIAALVTHAGIDAPFYTVGDPESFDVRAATDLARSLHARHDVHTQRVDDIVAAWPDVIGGYVAQNDAMASAWLMGDTIGADDVGRRHAVAVQGLAGEMARWRWIPLRMQYRPSRERSIAYFTRRLDRIGLSRPAVRSRAAEFIDAFTVEALDDGFERRDLVMAWYTSERARRWGGGNNRKISNVTDVFTPFTTRPFMQAAWQLPPAKARAEPIHHDLVKQLAPVLYDHPPESGRWPVQVPYVTVVVDQWRKRARTPRSTPPGTAVHGQHRWPGALRHHLRERWLDTASSLWEVVDREVLARVLLDDDDRPRMQAASTILDVATILEYEAFRASPRL